MPSSNTNVNIKKEKATKLAKCLSFSCIQSPNRYNVNSRKFRPFRFRILATVIILQNNYWEIWIYRCYLFHRVWTTITMLCQYFYKTWTTINHRNCNYYKVSRITKNLHRRTDRKRTLFILVTRRYIVFAKNSNGTGYLSNDSGI